MQTARRLHPALPARRTASFRRPNRANRTKVPHIRKAHDIARGLGLVLFEPIDVLHDLAKADQQVDFGLGIGLTLQDLECPVDVLSAFRYVFASHLKAPFGCTLELPFRAL
jgi:hypothetical protein